MNTLIVLIGLPGAGKSTFAGTLSGALVSTDAVRQELYGGESVTLCETTAQRLLAHRQIPVDDLSPRELAALKESLCVDHIFDVARERCRTLLAQGNSVIYDSTNFKKKYRQQLLEKTRGTFDRCDAYFLDIPLDVCLARNAGRSRREPDGVITAIASQLVPPSYEEGFDNIYRVDSQGRVSRVPHQSF